MAPADIKIWRPDSIVADLAFPDTLSWMLHECMLAGIRVCCNASLATGCHGLEIAMLGLKGAAISAIVTRTAQGTRSVSWKICRNCRLVAPGTSNGILADGAG